MAHGRRLASLAGPLAGSAATAPASSAGGPAGLRFACATTPGDAEPAVDGLGNAWRLLSDGAIQRADCYLRSCPWTDVDPPDGAAAISSLATVAAGPVYATDGARIFALDGRRGPVNTTPEQRTSPPSVADFSGLGFDPGFGVWVDTGASVAGHGRITALGRTLDGLLKISTSSGAELQAHAPQPTDGTGRDGTGGPKTGLVVRPLQPPPSWAEHWREIARLPGGGNHDVSCAIVGDEGFVAGGIGDWVGFPADVHLFSELWAYCPSKDSWRVAGRMPHATCFCGLAALGGKVFVVGGGDDRGPRPVSVPAHAQRDDTQDIPTRALRHVQIFDVASSEWTAGPPLSARREGFLGHLALAAGGRVYSLTCPSDDEHFANGLLVESCTLDAQGECSAWRPEPSPPLQLDNPAGAAVGDVLYAVGAAGVCAFDTQAGSWSVLPPMPSSLTAPHVCEHEGALWVVSSPASREEGGTACYCYSPEEKTWSAGPEAPVNSGWGGAASMGGRVLLVSGAYRSSELGATVFDDRCFAQISGEESALISRVRGAVAAAGGSAPAAAVVEMEETVAMIDRLYECSTTVVTNGDLQPATTASTGPGSNSLKICCWAQMHGLSTAEAVALFGSTGQPPELQNHANIEQLLKTGLDGFRTDQPALAQK